MRMRIKKPFGACPAIHPDMRSHLRCTILSAIVYLLIVVTNNVTKFDRVPGLRFENWVGQ